MIWEYLTLHSSTHVAGVATALCGWRGLEVGPANTCSTLPEPLLLLLLPRIMILGAEVF